MRARETPRSGQRGLAQTSAPRYGLLHACSHTTAHIQLDDRGVAWIDDTKTKVVEVVLDMIAHGWSPEEIHFQHPHLSLAQIHAALGYYYDHQAQIDADIRRSAQQAERLWAQAGESPLRRRWREQSLTK